MRPESYPQKLSTEKCLAVVFRGPFYVSALLWQTVVGAFINPTNFLPDISINALTFGNDENQPVQLYPFGNSNTAPKSLNLKP